MTFSAENRFPLRPISTTHKGLVETSLVTTNDLVEASLRSGQTLCCPAWRQDGGRLPDVRATVLPSSGSSLHSTNCQLEDGHHRGNYKHPEIHRPRPRPRSSDVIGEPKPCTRMYCFWKHGCVETVIYRYQCHRQILWFGGATSGSCYQLAPTIW